MRHVVLTWGKLEQAVEGIVEDVISMANGNICRYHDDETKWPVYSAQCALLLEVGYLKKISDSSMKLPATCSSSQTIYPAERVQLDHHSTSLSSPSLARPFPT